MTDSDKVYIFYADRTNDDEEQIMAVFLRLEYPPGPDVNHPNPIEASGDGLSNPDSTYDYYGPFVDSGEAEGFLHIMGAVQRVDEAHEGGSVWNYGNNGIEVIVIPMQDKADFPQFVRPQSEKLH